MSEPSWAAALKSLHPSAFQKLDDKAKTALYNADADRAEEILNEMEQKGREVRNPSAFVAKAVRDHPEFRGRRETVPTSREARDPTPRGSRNSDIDSALAKYGLLSAGIDEGAMSALNAADPLRAQEIISELAQKGKSVRNPSAFISKALREHPEFRGVKEGAATFEPIQTNRAEDGFVEEALARHGLKPSMLDERAIAGLRSADPARVSELLLELTMKWSEVRNPSAFVFKALRDHPEFRGPKEGHDLLEAALAKHGLLNELDNSAMTALRAADPARSAELVSELSSKGREVRNPSAFVVKALREHPECRGPSTCAPVVGAFSGFLNTAFGAAFYEAARAVQPHGASVESTLSRYGVSKAKIDEGAMMMLRGADPNRMTEIVMELAEKGNEVRNPSAFVSKALREHPEYRGGRQDFVMPIAMAPLQQAPIRQTARRGDMTLTKALNKHRLGEVLDDVATRALFAGVPDRALEVVEEIAAKGGDVRNPSAFVIRAMQQFPTPRGRRDDHVVSSSASGVANGRGSTLDAELAKFGLEGVLDNSATLRLKEADPARALELIKEIAMDLGKIDNPSGFVVSALRSHPKARGVKSARGEHQQSSRQMDTGVVQAALQRHGLDTAALDASAMTALYEASQERALEIIEDLAAKFSELRNPSAFICKALRAHPEKRARTA